MSFKGMFLHNSSKSFELYSQGQKYRNLYLQQRLIALPEVVSQPKRVIQMQQSWYFKTTVLQ